MLRNFSYLMLQSVSEVTMADIRLMTLSEQHLKILF